jgi:alkylhydroperoxidase family enzyme
MGAPMNNADRVWRVGSELRALRPEAMAWLDVANERAWGAIQPSLLEQVRLRVGALIGNKAGLARRSSAACAQGLTELKIAQLSTYYESQEFSALEKRCLAFAEQFVIDVTRLTAADLSDLGHYFSDEQLHDFVVALYVTECTQRLEMMGPALLGGIADSSAVVPPINVRANEVPGGIESALDRYQEAVVRGTALDPVTAEMVRLRCARTHNCRICRTLRLVNAREAGVDDAMTAKIDFYEKSDLDERIKLALRITDAFITRADTLTEATVRQAGGAFTPQALAELCLDITKWSTQKIHVALGTDGADTLPKNDQGMSFFTFDPDGRVAGFTAAPD